jgi:hypothetical protein
VVADHLSNPRGLAPGRDGGLYLAEAGSGGDTCVSGGPGGTTCIGLTGSFDLVTGHGVKRLVTGLISGSGEGGVAAEGPVSVSAGRHHTFYGQFGLSSHEVPPAGTIPAKLRAAALAQLGHLVKAGHSGWTRSISDVGDQDWTWTSKHHGLAPNDFPDANLNAVRYSHGHRYVRPVSTPADRPCPGHRARWPGQPPSQSGYLPRLTGAVSPMRPPGWPA